MSTLTTHTTASRDSHSLGLCKFNTTTNAIEVSDGSVWSIYDPNSASGWSGSNTYSLNFDGTDDYLNTSTIVTPSATSGTISAWIKIPASAGSVLSPIMSWTDMNINSATVKPMFACRNGKLRFYFQDGGTVDIVEGSSTGLNDNAWHHVAVTSDGSSYAIYLDGSAETLTVITGSNSGSWVGDISGGTLTDTDIGASRRHPSVGGSTYAVGNIDEVAVWDSALTAGQIDNIYKGESNGGSLGTNSTPGNLVSFSPKAWWRMGDGLEANSGTTVYDMSNFSNDMTIVNATSGTNTAGAVYQSDTP